MKTILVPTDFSPAANNATRYAVEFAKHLNAEKIVLYNAYSIPVATEATWALIDADDLRKNSQVSLHDTADKMRPYCGEQVNIEILSDFGFVEDRIGEIAARVNADMVIMGTSGSGGLERTLFGSNALVTIQQSVLPVLVVPPEAAFKAVTAIAWACDYHNVVETTPFKMIDTIMQLTKAKLHVVHNPPAHKTPGALAVSENMHLREFLEDPSFEVAVVEGPDLSDAINQYVEQKEIDWLIVVPKKHGWLSGLFSKNHTKELLFHTHIPMLCLHQ